VVKFKPPFDSHESWKYVGQFKDGTWMFTDNIPFSEWENAFPPEYLEGGGRVCPYGQVGDRLWVRETFRIFNSLNECSCYDDCACSSHNGKPMYRADNNDTESKWTPSIHMPRWASRITLEITDIRVERVQDISYADCLAEGMSPVPYLGDSSLTNEDIRNICVDATFKPLWDSINAKPGKMETDQGTIDCPGYSWDANPWVWVIEFKVL
jgi:hypothetical protein